jgi:hypothetical protein
MGLALNMSTGSFAIKGELKLLPPPSTGRWRLYERMALQVRGFAGVDLSARLDPFALADSLKVRVIYLKDLVGLSDLSRARLEATDNWSGGATSDLGDGSHAVVLNHKHSMGRQAATLMEEVCHILFGHKLSGIAPDRVGGRSYNFNIEEEAYAVGAAALVPYHSLRGFLTSGLSIRGIANHFGVTRSLVVYRSRGLRLHDSLA